MFFQYIVVLFVLVLSACVSVPERVSTEVSPEETLIIRERLALVRDIQSFEQEFGLVPTENFRSYDPNVVSYPLCYRAGVLSLDGHFAAVTVDACNVAPSLFDTFVFRAEAVATIKTPITSSFLEATHPRFVMVVFHEDFHEQTRGAPSRAIDESAATIMGLLYAREYIRRVHGVHSAEFKEAALNIAVFRANARILLGYEGELAQLYRFVSLGKHSQQEGITKKEEIFVRMHKECAALVSSVQRTCRKIANNAELSYDLDYARHFELFYQLYISCDEDVRKTGLTISALAQGNLTEDAYILRTQHLIQNRCTE